MHELSIAMNLLEIAESAAKEAGVEHVSALHLRLGIFSGVVAESLLFAYAIATENTFLAGSKLLIEEVPLVIYCPSCAREQQLDTMQAFVCPSCGAAVNEIRQGKEIELSFLEVADETETA